ncbi:MAG: hypothetical protein ACTSRU_15255 [Candidatus Hodarchaeales archaeon]
MANINDETSKSTSEIILIVRSGRKILENNGILVLPVIVVLFHVIAFDARLPVVVPLLSSLLVIFAVLPPKEEILLGEYLINYSRVNNLEITVFKEQVKEMQSLLPRSSNDDNRSEILELLMNTGLLPHCPEETGNIEDNRLLEESLPREEDITNLQENERFQKSTVEQSLQSMLDLEDVSEEDNSEEMVNDALKDDPEEIVEVLTEEGSEKQVEDCIMEGSMDQLLEVDAETGAETSAETGADDTIKTFEELDLGKLEAKLKVVETILAKTPIKSFDKKRKLEIMRNQLNRKEKTVKY